MTDHLTHEQVDRYVRRTLPPLALLEIDDHLSECRVCRERVASALPTSALIHALQRSLFTEETSSEQGGDRPVRRVRQRAWSIGLEGVVVEPGDEVGVEVVGMSGTEQELFLRAGSARVGGNGRIQVHGPASGPARLTVVTRDRNTGRFRVLGREVADPPGPRDFTVIPVEQNLWRHRLLHQLSVGSEDRTTLSSAARKLSSLNFFDDIKVYAGEQVFLDESFDDYSDGAIQLRPKGLRGLKAFWSGKAAYVTHALHAPGSGPGCWANEAYPNWNRQDVIEITPQEVPAGVPLTFEASFYMTDVRRGISIGLTRPYRRGEEEHQLPIAYLQFMPTEITINVRPYLPTSIQPFEWHRVRVDCNLDRHTIEVHLDGQLLGSELPMWPDENGDYRFTHFVIGGINFVLDVV